MPRKKIAVSSPNLSPAVSRGALIAVEVIGLGIAVYLTLIAFRWIYDGEVPCLRSKLFACESVVRGMFSKIGPFSIAVLGTLYFAGQLVLTILLSRGRWAVVMKSLAVFSGLLFVAWLRSLELVYLKKLCPWCWGVAFMVLAQTALTWPLATPPLPALRWPGRIGAAVVLLFAFLGLTTSVELLFKPSSSGTNRFFGWKPAETELASLTAEAEPEIVAGTASAKPDEAKGTKKGDNKGKKAEKTPAPAAEKTPAPPRETPAPRNSPPAQSAAALTRRPAPTPAERIESAYQQGTPAAAPLQVAQNTAPRPTPAPAAAPAPANEPEPPVDLPDVPELQMMQQRGWRMVASTERVEQLVSSRGPVLLMVYDPFCEECHATMRGMNSDEVERLPVTRVAIDQSSLTGNISAQVSHVPTLLLLDRQGQLLWKHEARIKANKLVEEVTSRVR